jgi:RimJ/RimL family protein N-acetyltransferase
VRCLRFRPSATEDAEFLWALRNDPEIVDTWWSSPPTDKAKWLAATVTENKNWIPYIVMDGDERIGRIAFERKEFGTEFSIGLVKAARDKGLGPQIIRMAYQFASDRNWLPLIATIKPDNTRSQRAFAKVGFERKELWVCTRRPLL